MVQSRFAMTRQERQHERRVLVFLLQCETEGRITSEELADLRVDTNRRGVPNQPEEEN